ncbi:unknown protein [Leptolyngbya sp. NIES-3755]|nr:unknown protein [Leptolyngbya sp. NIES-3755]
MDIEREIEEIAVKIKLRIDNPDSVKLQVKNITLAQKQLRASKKRLSNTVKNINQNAAQSSPDTLGSVLYDLTGNRKLAGRSRALQRQEIQRKKRKSRQPYINTIQRIDELILREDQLKLLAEEYLIDPEAYEAQIRAQREEKEREEARMRLLQEQKLAQEKREEEEKRLLAEARLEERMREEERKKQEREKKRQQHLVKKQQQNLEQKQKQAELYREWCQKNDSQKKAYLRKAWLFGSISFCCVLLVPLWLISLILQLIFKLQMGMWFWVVLLGLAITMSKPFPPEKPKE